MRRPPTAMTIVLALAATASLPAPAASAAPPPNDARTAPQPLGALPATVRATTAEATLDPDEPASCRPIKGSVWYAFTARSDRAVLAALDAAGDMDAVIEVFVRERSQLAPVTCQATNRSGQATIDLDAEAGTAYAIRVAPRANSVADAFTLRVVVPDEPARPPGQPLAAAGVNAAVDRFANPDDSWGVRLQAGRTYRLNFVTPGAGCALASLHPPGIGDYGQTAPLRTLRCDGHTVFTPSVAGRYSVLVRAPRASRDRLPYRLRIGRAQADDTAPGRLLANDRRVRGALEGSELDGLDLYRFALGRRSDVRFRLRTGAAFDVEVMDDSGRRRGCACGPTGDKRLERRLRPGRYFVAVRARDGADGRYVLSRLARTITRSRTLAGGRAAASLPAGAPVRLSLRVTPAVDGRATLLVERFDPLAGWLFASAFHPRLAGGLASVDFRPPSPGRWRVTGAFDGTRVASASAGGTARFRVVEPPGPD